MKNVQIFIQKLRCNCRRNFLTFQMEHQMNIRSFIMLMLKKLFSLFRRPVQEKPFTPPAPVRCYQPNLPFD